MHEDIFFLIHFLVAVRHSNVVEIKFDLISQVCSTIELVVLCIDCRIVHVGIVHHVHGLPSSIIWCRPNQGHFVTFYSDQNM